MGHKHRCRPVFARFFEANGLAVAGREPYASLLPQLVEAWIDRTSGFIDGPKKRRRREAEAADLAVRTISSSSP